MTCDWCSLPPNRCMCVGRAAPVAHASRKLPEPATEDHAHYFRVIGAAFMRWQMAKELDMRAETMKPEPRWLDPPQA